MALRQFTFGSFGPFVFDDDLFPEAFKTDGVIEGETVKGTKLEVDEVVTELRVKSGGSIVNDNDTFELTDTGFKLKDTTGQFEAEFFSASFRVSDLINALRAFVRVSSIQFDTIPTSGPTEFGRNDTLGFSFIEFPGASGVFRFLGGKYKFYDNTDATSSTTGAVQCAGGISAEKTIYAGTDVQVGRNIHIRGITNVTELPFGAANEGLYYRVDDSGLAGDPISIPTATGSGRIIIIKDIIGTFDSEPLTLSSASSTIDGNANRILDKFRQCITLIDAASGKWEIINDVGF